VRGSIHAKLEHIRDAWRERAKATGADVEEIDTTFVVDHLLADKTDEELQQWGGEPTTDGKATWLKKVAESSAAVAKKHH
jgi:hypothetical protein